MGSRQSMNLDVWGRDVWPVAGARTMGTARQDNKERRRTERTLVITSHCTRQYGRLEIHHTQHQPPTPHISQPSLPSPGQSPRALYAHIFPYLTPPPVLRIGPR